MRALALLLAPVTACLSLPARPADVDGGADASTDPDAAISPCDPGWAPPGGASPTPFPTGAVFRTLTVGSLGGDASDDILLVGQAGPNLADTRAVYIAYGHASMSLRCYDLALDVGSTTATTDVLAVAVADATGDDNPDVLVLTRELRQPTVMVVRLFVGAGDGTLASMAKTTIDGDVGGVPGDPDPTYVLARRTAGGHEVVFGGLNDVWTSEVTGTTLANPAHVDPLMDGGSTLQNIQDMRTIPAASGAEDVLVVTQDAAYEYGPTSPTTFALQGTSAALPSGAAQRFFRAGLATATSIEGVSGAGDRVDFVAAPPASTDGFQSASMPMMLGDMALTRLVDGIGRDVVVLGHSTAGVELAVFLATEGGQPSDIIGPPSTILAGELLAAGHFDDNLAAPASFYVVPGTVSAVAPSCFFVDSGLQSQLEACP
jgi:hypothetical protein